MFLAQSTWRATIVVCVVLVFSFIATGFISSEYRRGKAALGSTHFQAGQLLAAHGDLEGAAEEYRKALLFSPDSTMYRLSLGEALVDAGQLNEAESHLEQLLQEDPTNGRINLMLARVAAKRGNRDDAIESYQRAVYEFWPANELAERRQARWELIGLLSKTDRRSELIGELLQLYGNLPSGDNAQKLRVGDALLNYGASSEAGPVFRDLLKSTPQDPAVHRGLAEVYFNAGDYVQARHEFQKALRGSQQDTDAGNRLELTNEIIDLDPALPSITALERLRRSENLLGQAIKDLSKCRNVETDDGLKGRLRQAGQGVARKPLEESEDAALRMQSMTQQLWKDKTQFCKPAELSDRAVDIVLQRVGQ